MSVIASVDIDELMLESTRSTAAGEFVERKTVLIAGLRSKLAHVNPTLIEFNVATFFDCVTDTALLTILLLSCWWVSSDVRSPMLWDDRRVFTYDDEDGIEEPLLTVVDSAVVVFFRVFIVVDDGLEYIF